MPTNQPYVLEIITREGQRKVFRLSAGKTVLGSAPHADISLPSINGLMPEHLLFIAEPKGCWVSCHKDATLHPLIHERPHTQGQLRWGTEFYLGELLCRLETTAAVSDTKATQSSKGPSAIVLFGLLAITGLLGWYLVPVAKQRLNPASKKSFLTELESSIRRFDTKCVIDPQLRQDDEAWARSLMGMADAALAKSERYAFEPSDGVEALELYARLLQCIVDKPSAQGPDPKQVAQAAKVLERKVMEDFAFYRANLQRALRDDDADEALVYVKKLARLGKKSNSQDLRTLKEMEAYFAAKSSSE